MPRIPGQLRRRLSGTATIRPNTAIASEAKRIVYRAAAGEKAVIKGFLRLIATTRVVLSNQRRMS